MRNLKQSPLKLNSKVLLVFEKNKNTVNNCPTDPTTGTITITTTSIMFGNLKKEQINDVAKYHY
ncbi:MAG: hypothetical protein WKF85_00060 [Chitinophagaceae bacterium]